MRPIKLVMSAFGSYGGVEPIEFNKMQNGLFLIAGDTGSGKSTIFDAIMFALYDTMSGHERESVMMRSEYAPEDRETFVEFTFSYGEEIYTVKRYPTYERRSKRKNKDGSYNITKQQGKVELTMPDGVQFNGKIAQINKKLEEITGLTAEQFNKIALIAQGEFQELIMDRTGKRKEIFKQIFSTQIYSDIEEAIRRKYTLEVAQMKDNSTKLEECFNTVDIWEDSPYGESLKMAFERRDTEPEGLVNVLQDEILRLENIRGSKDGLYRDKENERIKLNEFITKGREKNKLIARLEELKASQKQLESLKEEMDSKKVALNLAKKAEKVSSVEKDYNDKKKDCDRARETSDKLKTREESLKQQYKEAEKNYYQIDEEHKRLMPEYITKIDSLTQAVSKYQDVEQKEAELAECDTSLKKAVISKEKEVEKLEKISEDMARFEGVIKSYEGLELCVEQAKSEKKKCDEALILLDKLKERKEVCSDKKKSLDDVRKELLSSVAKWEKSRRTHEDYNRMYIACQSAFLAEKLMPDMPCPVCGSLKHPQMAQVPNDAVTEDMVKKAMAAEKKCGVTKDNIQKKVEKLQSELASDVAVLSEYIAQLSGDTTDTVSADKDFSENFAEFTDRIINKNEVLISRKKFDISKKIEELEAKVTDKKSKQTDLEKLGKKQTKVVSDIETKKQKIHQFELEAEGLRKEVETLRASLEYGTRDEAEKRLKECKTQLDTLEKNHRDTDVLFKNIQKQLTSVQGELKEAERQTERDINRLEELSKAFENALEENGFNSVSEYRSAMIDAKTMKSMESDIKKYEYDCIKAGTGIQTIAEQLDDTDKVELKGLEQQLKEIDSLMSCIKGELDRYNLCIQSNNKAMERIQALMQERGSIAKRLRVAKSLNEVTNGKVRFQTYIQRQYFKQIIQAANTRLSGMASGQFLLQCRDIGTGGRGETGLELDVYNPVTGKSRDAHTLSGGETFMASLSMALGMADIVQNTVGKTKLNTMFIDEGFGSLSDDVRNKAVSVLLELAGSNRLVGVISHVSELKEQIPDKLVVTKGNNGSSVKWEEIS